MSCENSRVEAINKAKEAGLEIVFTDDQTLHLDIDSEADLEHARKNLNTIRSFFSTVTYTRSKSNRWHIYVNLKKPMSRLCRVALQACLGSDRCHELLNWKWETDGNLGEMFFFEKPDAEHQLFRLSQPKPELQSA